MKRSYDVIDFIGELEALLCERMEVVEHLVGPGNTGQSDRDKATGMNIVVREVRGLIRNVQRGEHIT